MMRRAGGLLIEVYPRLDKALRDAAQQVTTEHCGQLVADIKPIAAAIGRTL